ncbi:methyltransferase family protein [Pseudohalocynthiibacter aestuariivivens]|jgi:protein-S-isoprenylcysteine O-methyltransferase Ste14|uniref:Methyltransferase family protein n=1 Tax=Pseudohalocynthiibacter aestuariivivens TaxID=1591409 RepID=A0ABV5J9X9_9RHOB|nr:MULTISPECIES: isoprenylcysteine carboxylmethyltransferase family protein [Pseudohalocynthiibacter]MBS9716841.1 isoprenylcysteine carboxylmethyltransferase family protein [Pseudohalocynthiibacter aestuariivivens]MCK0102066.1 isoprenylcysteine carboxylmethyltransferase family protein [Pseudohalocynthiibacter sp. F2068]
MKSIDVPPVWLAAFLALAWCQTVYLPGLTFGGAWADFLGGICLGGGILLLILSLREFTRHKTTVHPHKESSNLIQTGVYKRSRNPIYLGDVLILTGLILYWDAVLSLPLVPIFVWIMEKRFIIPEEDRLRKKFRVQFAAYMRKTRRWL